MLDSLYNEKITIKTITGGNAAEGYETTISEIDGAIFSSKRRNEQKDGTVIMTNNVLNTKKELDINKTLIVFEGRDKTIQGINRAYNHFDGQLDHWEYSF